MLTSRHGSRFDVHAGLGRPSSDKVRGQVDPIFELRIDPAIKGAQTATTNLYEQLKCAIVAGRLAAGARMPGTRQAKKVYGVARNTAAEVYEQLLDEGYLTTRRGSGTYVADRIATRATAGGGGGVVAHDHRINAFWLDPDTVAAVRFWQGGPGIEAGSGGGAIDFRPAMVDWKLFPHAVLRKVVARQMRELEKNPPHLRNPQVNQGNFALREAIGRHIALTRAVACQPDDIVVTSGAQQAFDLLARTLVTRNETIVAIEDPGYPPMRVAFAAAGAILHPVGVDDEGLIVEDLPPGVGIICVTPSHQFPLGMMMSARRRQALIAFARRHGAVVIEDDYDGEFRYDGVPLTALRSAADADVVVYVGTFSKCMLPSLRLGFMVVPPWALPSLVLAKNALDWHCSTPLQQAVAGFIVEGQLDRHIRKMRNIYRQRRQSLLASLREELADGFEPVPSLYGMHVTALARHPVDLERAAEKAGQFNLKIHTLSRYYLGQPAKTGLIFGFGAVDLADIKAGLRALRTCLGAL